MKHTHLWKFVSCGVGLFVISCGTPGTVPSGTTDSVGVDEFIVGDRQLLLAGSTWAFESLIAEVPAELSLEEGAKVLVTVPASAVAESRYNVQQVLGRTRFSRGFDLFDRDTRGSLLYYPYDNYYLPYVRSGDSYVRYNDVLYGNSIFDDDDRVSPFYYLDDDTYYPYTYTSLGSDRDQRERANISRTVPVMHVVVNIQNYEFLPNNFRVQQGGTVLWTNMDNVVHNVTSDTGNPPTTTGNILPGASSTPITFTRVGRFPYHCQQHPEMRGTFQIVAAPSASPSPSISPSTMPSVPPTTAPTIAPTASPSAAPTTTPTTSPEPTTSPTLSPTP